MKRLFCLLAILLFVLAITAHVEAALVTLDFDDLQNNANLNTQYAAQGVTFENTINLVANELSPWPWGSTNVSSPIAIHAGLHYDYGNPNPTSSGITTATFSIPVDYVEVTMATVWTNWGPHMWLELYNANGDKIASAWQQNSGGAYRISASAPDVASAKFWTSGSMAAPYFDNFIFGTNSTAVPEPGTIILLAAGIFTMCVGRKLM